jgi:AcrR family transcriptional regulator
MAKPPDPRVERSRERVLDVAQALLAECGVGGFSVDEVSRRCGVAKTTIYRHWPSRETLVLDAASRISAAETVPDAGSLDAELRQYLGRLAELLQTARWSSVVPSIVDVAERDDEFAKLHGAIQRGHADPLRQILIRAVERGELSITVDQGFLVSALIGPLYYRRWFSREPMDDDFVDQLVGTVAHYLR